MQLIHCVRFIVFSSRLLLLLVIMSAPPEPRDTSFVILISARPCCVMMGESTTTILHCPFPEDKIRLKRLHVRRHSHRLIQKEKKSLRNFCALLNLTDLQTLSHKPLLPAFPRPLTAASLTIWPSSGIHVRPLLQHASSLISRARALPREAVETCSCDVKKRHLVGSRWLAWGAVRVFRESPRGLPLYSESMKIKDEESELESRLCLSQLLVGRS